MKRFDVGVAVTLIIAIIGGALYIGRLEGRVSSLEQDKDYSSIQKSRDDAVVTISKKTDSSVKLLDEKIDKVNSILKTDEEKRIAHIADIARRVDEIETSHGNYKITTYNVGRVSQKSLAKHFYCALAKIQSDYNTVVGNTFQWVEKNSKEVWVYHSNGQVADHGGVVCFDYK